MTAALRPASRAGDIALVAGAGLAMVLLLTVLVLVVGASVVGGLPRLTPELLFGESSADPTRGGIGPAIQGTVVLTLLMTLAGAPIGIVTGIYLSELAGEGRVARWVRASIRAIAGIPSIVIGLFGLGFFVLFLGGELDALTGQASPFFGRPAVIWSSLTLALLTLPVVVVATEEAARAIPAERREAALALGATRLHVLTRVVLKGARPGILTGTILAIGRAAGEVAPILFTGAASYLPELTKSPFDMHMHLGVHVYTLSTQSADLDAAGPTIHATVLVLLVTVLGANGLAAYVRSRSRAAS